MLKPQSDAGADVLEADRELALASKDTAAMKSAERKVVDKKMQAALVSPSEELLAASTSSYMSSSPVGAPLSAMLSKAVNPASDLPPIDLVSERQLSTPRRLIKQILKQEREEKEGKENERPVVTGHLGKTDGVGGSRLSFEDSFRNIKSGEGSDSSHSLTNQSEDWFLSKTVVSRRGRKFYECQDEFGRKYYCDRHTRETFWSLDEIDVEHEGDCGDSDDEDSNNKVENVIDISVDSDLSHDTIQSLTTTLKQMGDFANTTNVSSFSRKEREKQPVGTADDKDKDKSVESLLPTTQYGLGPITPPDVLATSNIYSEVNVIENTLDAHLRSFQNSLLQRSGSGSIAPYDQTNGTEVQQEQQQNAAAPQCQEEDRVVSVPFAEYSVGDQLTMKVAKMPDSVRDYLERGNLRLVIDARLERTMKTNAGRSPECNKFANASQSGHEDGAAGAGGWGAMRIFKALAKRLIVTAIFLTLLLLACSNAALVRAVSATLNLHWMTANTLPVIIGEKPTFFIRDESDGWCFNGTVFKVCDSNSLFKGEPSSESARHVQIRSNDLEGSCLAVNKRMNLSTDSCLTGRIRGKLSDNTVFSYDSGILTVLFSKTGERLCIARKENHSVKVGKCEDVGYTPLKISAVVEKPNLLKKHFGLSYRTLNVGGFEDVAWRTQTDRNEGKGEDDDDDDDREVDDAKVEGGEGKDAAASSSNVHHAHYTASDGSKASWLRRYSLASLDVDVTDLVASFE